MIIILQRITYFVGYNVKGNNTSVGRTELHSSCNSMFILNTSPSPDYIDYM